MEEAIERIPIVLLTGFLGSGKTTFLARALGNPALRDTLVLVNELGSIGLDHELLWSGGEIALSLDSGCICCSVSDDLLSMLADLYWQRLHRDITRFNRVVIETTGIADPRAIVSALRTNPLVNERYRYAGTITVVDAQAGMKRVRAHDEALSQVAIADVLMMSKIDLVSEAAREELADELKRLNPLAKVVSNGEDGGRSEARLFALDRAEIDDVRPDHSHLSHGTHRHRHPDVESFVVSLSDAGDEEQIQGVLEDMARAAGDALLRAKGVVRVNGADLLIQMVGSVLSPLKPLPAERPEAATGFLVIIGKEIDETRTRAVLVPITREPD